LTPPIDRVSVDVSDAHIKASHSERTDQLSAQKWRSS
jgi:hypothetical protein